MAEVALIFSVVLGYLAADAWLAGRAGTAFKVFLSPGLGLGFTASVLFLIFYTTGGLHPGFAWLVHLAAFLALGTLRWRRRRAGHVRISAEFLLYAALISLGALLMSFRMLKAPFGSGLDVWALWKLKARFLFYPNDFWANLFSSALNFNCPDYPLLYPLAMVWGWLAAGQETLSASWTIAFMFTLSSAGLVTAALRSEAGRTRAFLAGLFLLSTPHFIGWGSSFYAEMAVSYMNLAAFVLAARSLEEDSPRFGLLAGVFFGLSVFSKNEGWLFAAASFSAVLLTAFFCRTGRRPGAFRRLREFALGAAPIVLLVVLFKWRGGLPNEKMNLPLILNALHAGDNGAKSLVILRFALEEVLKENAWVYAWLFFLSVFAVRIRSFFKPSRFWMFLALVSVQIGFFCAYLISPVPLTSNVATSIDRLLVQSFPCWTFLVFHVWSEGLP